MKRESRITFEIKKKKKSFLNITVLYVVEKPGQNWVVGRTGTKKKKE